MSGGQLVVLDRLGRDVKRFPLAHGLVTLGSDHSCDIRFMLETVSPHHATVAVHANQTVVRDVCGGGTQVNGREVSVAALRHGDVITIGGRQLRWEYADPAARRPQAPLPALFVARREALRRGRRGSGPAPARRDPALQLALEMSHRASMPANAGGKQVAIVQPQRRDTTDQNDKPGARSPQQASKRQRTLKSEVEGSTGDVEAESSTRKCQARGGVKSLSPLHGTTKASLWIESRRRPGGGATPLRLAVLRRAHSAHRHAVTKIEEPLTIDHTKQAAILLMTGHTPKSKLLGQKTPSPNLTKSNLASPKSVTPKSSNSRSVTPKSSNLKSVTPKSSISKSVTPKSSNSRSVTPKSSNLKSVTPKSSISKSVTPKSSTSRSVTPKSSTSKSVTPKSSNSRSVTPKSSISKSVTPKSVTPKSASPKSASSKRGGRRSGSYVVKKKSPVPKSTPRGRKTRASAATASPQDRTVTLLDITDSEGRNSSLRSSSRRSDNRSSEISSLLLSPRKSALKDPKAKTSMRKTESIKFDLSNLENYSQESDVVMLSSSARESVTSESDMSLHYDTSSVQSPSPRRSIHSRSSKILEKSLGSSVALSPSQSKTLTPESPRPRKSLRGSLILQKALNETDDTLSYSRRTTKSVSSASQNTTVASAFRTRTLSPRSPQNSLESYSIVDLVSIDSNESRRSTSVYDSAGSATNTTFGTPQTTARKTRSTINAVLVDSSTPYVKPTRSSVPRSRSSSNSANKSSSSTSRLTNRTSTSSRRTKSLSTPESSVKHVSVNSTRISRASRSRSRITDSDLMLVDQDEADDSPRSSKRLSTASKRSSSSTQRSTISKKSTPTANVTENEGTSTPENKNSPEEASTPVLSIQSLLDSSQSSILSSKKKRGRPSLKRKTIGVLTGPKTKVSAKSKSMNFSARKTRHRLSNDSYENMNVSVQQNEEIVTPKSGVKLIQEAVKNKHSTAKKPQSKRSIIDDLNDSDIVKQLFNSPVKRKLSQSMTEFSKKLDNDDVVQVRRPTRNTVAVPGRTPDRSLLDRSLLNHTEAFTPERFVSPISTPSNSPNLTGIKLMFAKKTPENDLRNVKGVKNLLRTPRARKSIKNDLTDVAGVKVVFAKSPRNRLSDVRVKEVFAPSPRNDLRRVSGVKSLFQSQKEKKSPRNSLSDVRGVKKLFSRKSPANDLRNVSGTKRILRRNSPRNDLSDVRGLKLMFRQDKHKNELSDLSGVEELFNDSNQSHKDADSLFDRLVGRPTVKAVYSKTFSSKAAQKKNKRNANSLHVSSLNVSTNNVEEWLEQELQKRLHKGSPKSVNKSKANMTRELQKLATDTVEGNAPLRTSRIRNSTVIVRTSINDGSKRQKSASELYSAHTLPIKKRSLVDASLERAKNDSKPINLPIKKRAVVHSTPVKGRQINMTMNASELGRVSPIVAEKTQDLESHVLPANHTSKPVEVRPKSRRGTKVLVSSPKFKKPSPQKNRGKSKAPTPIKTTSPKPPKLSPANKQLKSPVKKPVSGDGNKSASPKTTRSRRTVVASPPVEIQTKKRGATLVVAKKSPVISPQPRASRRKKDLQTVPTTPTSPKRTRTTQTNDKAKTPKNTRAKIQKATVVVVKPSPQLKPRATRGRAQQTDINTLKANKAGGKKVNSKKVESPKKAPASKKTPKNVTVEEVLKTRGRKTLKDTSSSADVAKSQGKTGKQDKVEDVPKTRGRKTAGTKNVSKQNSTDDEKLQPKTRRGRNTTAEEPVATRNAKKGRNQEPTEVMPKTNTKKAQKQEKVVEEKKTRGRKVIAQESVQSEPTTRSRRGNKVDNTAPPVQNSRKRKSTASNERPSKLRRKEVTTETKSSNKKIQSPKANTTKKSVTKESEQKIKKGDTPKKTTRSKKAEKSIEAPKEQDKKSGRGRKTVIAEAPPEVGKRKRKTAVEVPPAQEGKKSRGKAAASPRATRAAITAQASKAGRSRRR